MGLRASPDDLVTSLVKNEPRAVLSPVPAPLAGPGVCAICHGPVRTESVYCWCCRKICLGLEIDRASLPPIVPLGLYRPGDPWNLVLRRYKDAPVAAARRYFANLLKIGTEHFLSAHGPCLTGETDGFDAYCVVPSSQVGRVAATPHPLEALLDRIPTIRSLRVVRLSAGEEPADHLKPSSAAFLPKDVERGTRGRVLVVDDSWVTGARALSAVAALGSAGWTVAGVLVLGRSIDTSASLHSRSWWAEHAGDSSQSATAPKRCCMRMCLSTIS